MLIVLVTSVVFVFLIGAVMAVYISQGEESNRRPFNYQQDDTIENLTENLTENDLYEIALRSIIHYDLNNLRFIYYNFNDYNENNRNIIYEFYLIYTKFIIIKYNIWPIVWIWYGENVLENKMNDRIPVKELLNKVKSNVERLKLQKKMIHPINFLINDKKYGNVDEIATILHRIIFKYNCDTEDLNLYNIHKVDAARLYKAYWEIFINNVFADLTFIDDNCYIKYLDEAPEDLKSKVPVNYRNRLYDDDLNMYLTEMNKVINNHIYNEIKERMIDDMKKNKMDKDELIRFLRKKKFNK